MAACYPGQQGSLVPSLDGAALLSRTHERKDEPNIYRAIPEGDTISSLNSLLPLTNIERENQTYSEARKLRTHLQHIISLAFLHGLMTNAIAHITTSTHQKHEPMSTTMTLTMAQAPEGSFSACPNCGESLPHTSSLATSEAQKQIEDLQAQVRLLNQKAASAGTSLLVPHMSNDKADD